MPGISVVIIAFNEAKNIKRCIDSVFDIADEVVLIDSFSTDNTVEIARNLGVQVFQEPFMGYVEQKNFAVTKAKNQWILSLDADEALNDELKAEILELKTKKIENQVFEFNRLNNYAGKWIRHGAWFPDMKTRLFNSKDGKWTGMNPHDKFEKNAGIKTVKLKGEILHWSYKTIADHKKKLLSFAEIGAHSYHNAGKKSSLARAWLSPIFRFLRDYLLKAGFLDGKAGFTIAWLTAIEVRLKYKILRKLQKQS